jgi:hypothetical protein
MMLHKPQQQHRNGRPPLPPRSRSGSQNISYTSNCSSTRSTTANIGKSATELQAKKESEKALHSFMNELMSKCCIFDGDNEDALIIHISPDNAKIPRMKSQDESSISSYHSIISSPDASTQRKQQLECLSPLPDKESRWSNASPSTLVRTIQTAVSVAEGTDSPVSRRDANHRLSAPTFTDYFPPPRSSLSSSRSSPKDLLHISMGGAGSGPSQGDVNSFRRTQSLSPITTRRRPLEKRALSLTLASPTTSRWDTSCSPEQSSTFLKTIKLLPPDTNANNSSDSGNNYKKRDESKKKNIKNSNRRKSVQLNTDDYDKLTNSTIYRRHNGSTSKNSTTLFIPPPLPIKRLPDSLRLSPY